MLDTTVTYKYDVVVVGSGAAGFNAANRIAQDGSKSVAIVTEGINCGTSRNTGSDKQTYYKLSLSGSDKDSVGLMAQNLFDGGSVDGDNALCEAALSPRCFNNLCELGVEFPCNRFGEYVGYKTDHDPFSRATSAGPLTSKFMTEALQKQSEKLNVPIYDNLYVISVLTDQNRTIGLACIDQTYGDIVFFKSDFVVLATGGPAGIYKDSVYPECHMGSTSLALKAGASLQNFTEWQYGLASTNPRWNVSGTYMQVLPRFVSIDKDGTEHEFLLNYYDDPYTALDNVFLKGYQWPFDSNKAHNGSSVIDLLVYRETALFDREVYLDFMQNPFKLDRIDFSSLCNEASKYLETSGANQDLPIDRLKHMNMPAYELYLKKGVNLNKKYLSIALCAQHNNGGIAVDSWWQTKVNGLFAVGECAGTHGVARPGGSALNSGQVGSLRAAQYILQASKIEFSEEEFKHIANTYKTKIDQIFSNIHSSKSNTDQILEKFRFLMSKNVAAIRNPQAVEDTLNSIKALIETINFQAKIKDKSELADYYRINDALITSKALCECILDFSKQVKCSRGSAIYQVINKDGNKKLEDMFSFIPYDKSYDGKVQEICLKEDDFLITWRKVRPIPQEDNNFEKVWASYRINKNVF